MCAMKILITGSNGLLGSNLIRYYTAKNENKVFATSLSPSYTPLSNFTEGDLLDAVFVDRLISDIRPDIIINTVSLVNIEKCEEDPKLASLLTVKTAENIARKARQIGTRLIYISTDHLFEGTKSFYSEEDEPEPVNVYGTLKYKAESRTRDLYSDAVIVRTNFYGWSHSLHPPTFGEWVFDSLKHHRPIKLFTDYYFTPIEVTYLAEALENVAKSDFVGIINIAGSQRCSKYEFGIALADVFQFDPGLISKGKIEATSFKVRRQKDLSLSTKKFKQIFNQKLPDLREGLQRFYENRGLLIQEK